MSESRGFIFLRLLNITHDTFIRDTDIPTKEHMFHEPLIILACVNNIDKSKKGMEIIVNATFEKVSEKGLKKPQKN